MRCTTAIVLATLWAAPPVFADVIWRGDFETGDKSQWTKTQEVDGDRLQVVTDPVRQGEYALRVEVRQGDDPINASGNRAEMVLTHIAEEEGDERWYSWSTMWPDDYPSNNAWQLFVQWHHSGNNGSPPMELYVNGETVHLRANAETVVWTHPLERGEWHDFLFHVKWSSDADVGFVELWYDGEKELDRTYVQTMYAGYVNYLKQGLYRKDTITQVGVLYHDGMTIGTTRADVDPGPVPEEDPDAAPPRPVDAGVPDARVRPDAPIDAAIEEEEPDAAPEPEEVDAGGEPDTGGGETQPDAGLPPEVDAGPKVDAPGPTVADGGCQVGGRGGAGAGLLVLALLLSARRRAARSARRSAGARRARGAA